MISSARRGAFSFVLHSHIPYVRHAGQWPFGEEWLYEALLESYLPLAEMLEQLASENISASVTLGITPILAEQLADDHLQEGFSTYLEEKVRRAAADAERFRRENNPVFETTAKGYAAQFERLGKFYRDRCHGNVLSSFRRLQDYGLVEVITSAATHAYLPLLSRDSSIQAQLMAGVKATQHHFGRSPQGVWLPECAYRSSRTVQLTRNESYLRPPLDEFLSSLGLKYFVVDSHAVEGGELSEGGKLHGLYRAEGMEPPSDKWPSTYRSVFRPYLTRSGVAVFGRHHETGVRVWSREVGYPANGLYREFYKRDSGSGLQYWRVTSPACELDKKEPYQADLAAFRAVEHAQHFVGMVERLSAGFQAEHNERGILVAAYDTELFGHWWHEGVPWLGEVLRRLAKGQAVDVVSLGSYLQQEPTTQVIELPECSWGQGGKHLIWENPQVEGMWPEIHAAEVAMENLLAAASQSGDLEMRYLRQAARELFLLQSSDWPFLVTTGQARDYARERFRTHLERFRRLARILTDQRTQDAESLEELSRMEHADNCFPRVDPAWFARRQPQPIHNPVPKFVGTSS